MIKMIRQSMVYRLILTVDILLLLSISTWAYFNIKYQKEKFMEHIVAGSDRFSNTIKLGTHYAMMLNSRDDITQIINNIGKQKEVENIRIYNKDGQIKFSNRAGEVDSVTNIKDEACYICHRTEPPAVSLDLSERIRMIKSENGELLLGIISPIYNESGCSTDACHVHPEDKEVLGALDVVVSLKGTDAEIVRYEKGIIGLAVFVFLMTSCIIFLFIFKFVRQPINKMIDGTRRLAMGDYSTRLTIERNDEIGELAEAINRMGKRIGEKQIELNKQRDEYQNLFELVPCIITVQDKNYRLIKYNREFAEKFAPKPGDFCYCAYKGRTEKCIICPVERTFEDGHSHYSEEKGINKDGTETHWLVRTSPIRDSEGNIIAAMEMSLDITRRKQLEEKLEKSEKKYYAIFNNIPNPVFVLDVDTLDILDCNESVKAVYGYSKAEIINRSFLDLFQEKEKAVFGHQIRVIPIINQIKHVHKNGKTIFVNMRVSPSEYPGKRVLLVTTSDITKRLETEQQLIQTSKMATLGEMATGVAHELNQPLSVIKTASNYLMKKVRKKEKIKDEILYTMAEEIDGHVDRATKIINHMRQFGRKSDLELEKIQINNVLKSAFEIFSQQLKVRGIDVEWNIQENIPEIMADPNRLEQVFINLLINARDAIEERWGNMEYKPGDKKISLITECVDKQVSVKVCDTGTGIPKAILDKIFDPFFTTKKVGEGTGLGLSISYGIIKDCGGNITAMSGDEDTGACFMITFPVRDTL
jgi:histidine kinase